MPRFYCPLPLLAGATVDLPETVAHHVHVLRLQPGDPLTLFNGDGHAYQAALVAQDKRRASARVQAVLAADLELPYAITIAQALPEASKMDWIVEKAVELGVAAIVPLAAQRCVVRLSAERAEKKMLHWQGIIVAAAEQCGRNRLTRLAPPAAFQDWTNQHDLHRRILLSPRASQSLSSWAKHQPPQAISLMIGPEGGFTEQEEEIALARGALALGMGTRILRTETAALAAVAGLNALWQN
ncbi:16S rRNA (uracil(1498)-N(3))-methyltransferase [Massilia sp. CF038]|uniref:16S rRNA (uracil(1498)-N(3))-methyltransferase n=1 Tax=Massilia sp. CF038 TaxID=1881045 RepID=UPI0009124208|nr:16S rRNA (uracil(1498)-N(3))-methyltransferase [Massilia sp. CF038]SHH21618.1 16S rRNA (uracil1498-N3)-methyltransferase [Massilia sp. CF038]